jgi:hypothetical protein
MLWRKEKSVVLAGNQYMGKKRSEEGVWVMRKGYGYQN